MGFKLSPWVVGKATRWIVEWARRQDTQVVWYVDDVLLIGPRRRIRSVLFQFEAMVRHLGLDLHPTKGWSEPKRRFVFLGAGVDLRQRLFFIPEYKLVQLAARCRRTSQHGRSHHRTKPWYCNHG